MDNTRGWVDHSAIVLSREQAGGGCFRLELSAPRIVDRAEPGQFVMVRAGMTTDPLLRRPLSIHDVDVEGGRLWLLAAVVGSGTKLLSRVAPGDHIPVSGPFGTGFGDPGSQRSLLLVAGGAGVAPLVFAASRWAEKVPTVAAVGAASADQLVAIAGLRMNGADVRTATDDGSAGFHGNVVELAAEILAEPPVGRTAGWAVWACGPRPMLRALSSVLPTTVGCRLSVETAFACGVGACAGCAIKRTAGGYARVCRDGPVFDAGEVVL